MGLCENFPLLSVSKLEMPGEEQSSLTPVSYLPLEVLAPCRWVPTAEHSGASAVNGQLCRVEPDTL